MSNTHEFGGDDPEINAAIEEAQHRLPEFLRALDEDSRRAVPAIEGALVKARFESTISHTVEHLWLEDVGFEDEQIVGTLANEPNSIPELSQGERVSVPLEDVSDWVYRLRGRTFGGFTIRVMQRRGLEP